MDRSILSIAEFYAEAGVDIALDEMAHDRFSDMRALRDARKATERAAAEAILDRVREPAPPVQERPVPVQPIARPDAEAIAGDEAVMAARDQAAAAGSLEDLRSVLDRFEGCALKRTAKSLVFSDGNPGARVMLVGEAPGRDEDIAGKPFVGRSGQLLDKMLAAIGLSRSDAYIANVIPWRPPGNRTPSPQETEICRPFIERQIELAAPDVLVLLGGASAKQLLRTQDGIMRLRGTWRNYRAGERDIEAIATLHPAYLLRQPVQKRLAWRDFLEIQRKLRETGM